MDGGTTVLFAPMEQSNRPSRYSLCRGQVRFWGVAWALAVLWTMLAGWDLALSLRQTHAKTSGVAAAGAPRDGQRAALLTHGLVWAFGLVWLSGSIAYLHRRRGDRNRPAPGGMEEALRQSERRYRLLFDEGTDGMAVADFATGVLLDCNRAMLEIVGWEKSELIGQPQALLHPPDDRSAGVSESFREHRESRQGEVLATTLLTKTGGRKTVEVRATVLDLDGSKVVLGVFRDVTQRQQVESALRESEERYRLLFNGITDAVFVHGIRDDDLPGALLAVNDAFCQRLGYSREELLQLTVLDIDAPESRVDREAIVRKLRQGESALFEQTHVTKDGRRVPVEIHVQTFLLQGRPLVLSVARDITDRKEAERALVESEAQLRHAQKMEAVGQLAGGVAHDFNNILTVILGSAGLLVQDAQLTTESRELARQIADAAGRAANLTRQLLAFSRKQVMQVRLLDLNEVLGQTLKMLQRVLGEHITLHCTYAPELPRVEADAGMLEQVVMNLAVNARDAMPKGGRLLVTTGTCQIESDQTRRSPEAQAGRFVTLALSDTGYGMDEATQARLFEPFFTTKDVGKGTGLGLATVYGIVKQHGGWVEVASTPGHGSTFTVFLPARAQALSAPAGVAPTADVVGGSETILLVEDDTAVRRLLRNSLQRFGYHVLEAAHGLEALQVWDTYDGQVDLLFTDIVMPGGMNGGEVADALLQRQPRLKVVFSSGYRGDVFTAAPQGPAGSCFLSKPYTVATLGRTVRACLDQSGG